jgi:riboflavin kinase / FMN adenylyltransferase
VRVVANAGELELRGCALCIGNFDGVHLGHQLLLRRLQHVSQKTGSPSVVLTFFPPAKVVFRGKPYLSSAEEKLHLLGAFSPDAVVMTPFSREYAQTPKEQFLHEVARLEPKYVIVGEDFRFGQGRSGGLDDLQHTTERLEVFSLERLEERVIKSSHIRELLHAGEVEEARKFLGYSYLAFGKVVHGDRRGRTIGFPTANLALPPEKALPLGVFAVRVETAQGRFDGMANVGPRPSYPDAPPSLEVHLFDFDDDLYGQTLRVSFEAFLRAQRKFSGLDDLKAQLSRDKVAARAKLVGHSDKRLIS